jgi:hypothetical protein
MLRSAMFVMVCAAAVLSACGDDASGTGGGGQGGGGTGGDATGGSGTGGSALVEGPGEFAIDYETSPDFFTAMSGPKPGGSPHGTQQTWYSTNLEPVIDANAFEAPVGTVSIKRFDMDGDGTDDGLAVMIKREAGYDSANADWYYDMRMLDGTIMADPPAGKIAMCIDCHQGYAATDYLAGTKVR